MNKEEIKPCPTHGGTKIAYTIEIQNDDGIWKPMEYRKKQDCINNCGIRRSKYIYDCEIFEIMDMFSYESAMALVWTYKSQSIRIIDGVRIIPHKIEFDIKAWKQAPEEVDFSKP